jgi:hypothetical protein
MVLDNSCPRKRESITCSLQLERKQRIFPETESAGTQFFIKCRHLVENGSRECHVRADQTLRIVSVQKFARSKPRSMSRGHPGALQVNWNHYCARNGVCLPGAYLTANFVQPPRVWPCIIVKKRNDFSRDISKRRIARSRDPSSRFQYMPNSASRNVATALQKICCTIIRAIV